MTNLRDRMVASETALATGRPPDTALALLNRMKPQISAALGNSPALQVDRFMRVALTEFRINAELLACTPESLMAAMLRAAELQLEIGGPLGQSFLVPFRSAERGLEAQLILGYRGRIALARRSGEIADIIARTVYRGDRFHAEYGLQDKLEHEPTLGERGESWAWYALARFKGGGHSLQVIGRPEVDRRRARSRAKNSPAWVNDYDAMGCKSAVNQLAPWLPLTAQAAEAWESDEIREFGADQVAAMLAPVPATPPPPTVPVITTGSDTTGGAMHADERPAPRPAAEAQPEPAAEPAPRRRGRPRTQPQPAPAPAPEPNAEASQGEPSPGDGAVITGASAPPAAPEPEPEPEPGPRSEAPAPAPEPQPEPQRPPLTPAQQRGLWVTLPLAAPYGARVEQARDQIDEVARAGVNVDQLTAAVTGKEWGALTGDEILRVASAAGEIHAGRAVLVEENGMPLLTIPQQASMFSGEGGYGPGRHSGRNQ